MCMENATIRDAENNAAAPYYASAIVRGYNGTVPLNEATGLSGNSIVIQGTMSATPFGASSSGQMISNAITWGNALLSSAITFWRIYDSTDTTCLNQIGASELTISPSPPTVGVAVSGVFTYSNPRGTSV